MPVTINGNGSITGLSVGGLGAGVVNTATLANGAATQAKRTYAVGEIIQTKFFQNKTQYSNNSNTTPTTIISGAITPTSSSNKIIITYHAQVAYYDGQKHCHVQILKGGSGDPQLLPLPGGAVQDKGCRTVTSPSAAPNN